MANADLDIKVDLNNSPLEQEKHELNVQSLEAVKEGEDIIKNGSSRFRDTDEMFAELDI